MKTGVKKGGSKRRIWGGIILATLAALFLWLTFPSHALAWDDCPRGEVDCAYPGYCSRYIDTDSDGICDRSQAEPTAPASTTAESAAASVDQGGGTGDSGGASFLTHYYISPIALAFFLVYLVSFILYKTKRIKIATHRKIWNVLLLVTFLITGIFGLILAIQLDYELPFRMPLDLLFWHVEAGIVMTLISLFHIGWHFNYYRNLLRTSRRKARAARAAHPLAVAEQPRLD